MNNSVLEVVEGIKDQGVFYDSLLLLWVGHRTTWSPKPFLESESKPQGYHWVTSVSR